MSSDQEIEAYFDWVRTERAKHRIMTVGEYVAWTRGGDAISSPKTGNAFPGGITILFNGPAIIGKTSTS